ncbi:MULTISPECIES: hypothetical protein [Amycolatopsis]|uniref:hypothetical protein n=1 Tax=Amycolatopsis TaxID=1813 RepID=UPI001C58D815|nr:hypothetical protein [Amycolatopsis sp. TNS106]
MNVKGQVALVVVGPMGKRGKPLLTDTIAPSWLVKIGVRNRAEAVRHGLEKGL